MENQDKKYYEILNDLFIKFRIGELNEKIKAINTLYDKNPKFNLIHQIVGDFETHDPEIEMLDEDNDDESEGDGGHGEVREKVKKTVRNMHIPRFDKIQVWEEVKKTDPKAKRGSVAAVLKKWAKDKHDEDGIKVVRKGKGPNPTIYKRRKES